VDLPHPVGRLVTDQSLVADEVRKRAMLFPGHGPDAPGLVGIHLKGNRWHSNTVLRETAWASRFFERFS
jgi:hypothetical protein